MWCFLHKDSEFTYFGVLANENIIKNLHGYVSPLRNYFSPDYNNNIELQFILTLAGKAHSILKWRRKNMYSSETGKLMYSI
eukprot:UN31099